MISKILGVKKVKGKAGGIAPLPDEVSNPNEFRKLNDAQLNPAGGFWTAIVGLCFGGLLALLLAYLGLLDCILRLFR